MNAIEQEREHLSATSLKQLQSCALQFRLQRLDGLSRSHRSPALITGGIYHGVSGVRAVDAQGRPGRDEG